MTPLACLTKQPPTRPRHVPAVGSERCCGGAAPLARGLPRLSPSRLSPSRLSQPARLSLPSASLARESLAREGDVPERESKAAGKGSAAAGASVIIVSVCGAVAGKACGSSDVAVLVLVAS